MTLRILLVAGACSLAACGGASSSSTPTGPSPTVGSGSSSSSSGGSNAGQTGLIPSRGGISGPLFDVIPIDTSDFLAFRTLGFLSPPIHMFPAKHSAFSMTLPGQTAVPRPVRAPGRVWVKEIWRVRYDDGFSNVPRPVYGHGLVYIATGFQQPTLLAVRADGTGDVTRTHIAWTWRRAAPFTPSPLLVGDELYVLSDLGIVSCLDARSGELRWQQRIGGNYSASPVYADGRIYFLSEEGLATVIEPGLVFRKLATSELNGGMLASMAVSRGSLFIRTQSHLYRIGAGQVSPLARQQ